VSSIRLLQEFPRIVSSEAGIKISLPVSLDGDGAFNLDLIRIDLLALSMNNWISRNTLNII
jgi:hypothetical protein